MTTMGSSEEELVEKTGIRTRRWLGPGETPVSLAAAAVRRALDAARLEPAQLKRLIFVSSTGGMQLIPATANNLLEELGIRDCCDGFDVNNACMGFLTSLDLAARCAATGLAPVCVVASESLSRHLTTDDPRPLLVLADASAAAIVNVASRGGILDASLGNNGLHRGSVTMAHPGLTGDKETIGFADSNREISRVALQGLTRCAGQVLSRSGMTMEQVDWFVPHQPNGSMLDKLMSGLGIPEDKVVKVVQEIGSVGAASIAVGLDELLRRKPVKPGDRVLMFGVGAGMSYGALLWEV